MINKKYVLNFPNDEVRKEYMRQQFRVDKVNNIRYISGINGHELNLDEFNLNLDRQLFRKLKPGEIGCLLGHLKIYQYALDKKESIILVMEDDVSICEDFEKHLRHKYRDLPSDWDIALLSSTDIWLNKYKKNCKLKDINEDYYQLIEGDHYGCQTYLIKENAMKKILECDTIIYPIDLLIGQLGLNVYITKTPISRQCRGLGSYTQSDKKLRI